LFVTVTLAISCGGPVPPAEFAPQAPYVTSDTAELNAVIVMPITDWIFKSSEMGSGLPFFSAGLPRATIAEHAAMVEIMEDAGVNVLRIDEVLTSAIQNARAEGALEDWLNATFPGSAVSAIERIDELDGRSLLNMRDDHFYIEDEEGNIGPVSPGMSSLYWTRDWAAMTPKGVIVGNSQNGNRKLEKQIARLVFGYAEGLRDIPIVFDAAAESVYVDGGDVIVLSDTEMLLGVGNRSNREAATKLAQRLDMDVYAVAMPPAENRTGLQRQLLHLDSTMNLVGEKTVLAIPYFYEEDRSELNPMREVLLGLAAQMEKIREVIPGDSDYDYRAGSPEYLQRTVEVMSEVGWVTHHKRGTGEAVPMEMKVVDFLRQLEYEVVYVGGEPGELPSRKHALEQAMYELRWQGPNVVQLGPGEVIAYEHNVHTNQALREAGITVHTFPGQSLSMRNGGPHCLTMPVLRGH
jgi:arginine deiminase